MEHADLAVELDPAFAGDVAVARDGGAVQRCPERVGVEHARDPAFVVVAAEDAAVARKVGRLVGPDQHHIVAQLAQVPCRRGPDQAAPDDRKFHRAVQAHVDMQK